MDKRSCKRSLSYAGLLFILVLFIILFLSMGWELQKKEYMLSGYMAAIYPEQESELLGAVNETERYYSDIYYEKGRALEEKYGFDTGSRDTSRLILRYFFLFCGLTCAAKCFCFCMRIYKSPENTAGVWKRITAASFQLTEEKEAKNGLIQERLKLEEGSKGTHNRISHQLKNPLASLKMSYELADTGCLAHRRKGRVSFSRDLQKVLR